MPANTPKGYPYPLGTDPVADGDDAIKNLANKVDAALPARTWVSTASVPVTASTVGTLNVTFPAGRFTAVPRISLTVAGVSSFYVAGATAVSSTGINIFVRHTDAVSASITITVHVMAVQMLANAGDG
jgi:hypothetical protein